jgi:hypothetical protein
MPGDIPHSVHGDDLPQSASGGTPRTVAVDCEHVEKMLHKGTRDQFTFYSDEPERMGGDNNYPAPLTYITAGIGF